jgi:hypothetical protein
MLSDTARHAVVWLGKMVIRISDMSAAKQRSIVTLSQPSTRALIRSCLYKTPLSHDQREVDRQQRHTQQHDKDRKPLAQACNRQSPRHPCANQQPRHATGEQ